MAALAFFLSIAVGALAASVAAGRPMVVTAWLIAAMVATFLVSMARIPRLWGVRGWLQRGCFAMIVAWLLLVAWMQ